jgi:hypothetical protein
MGDRKQPTPVDLNQVRPPAPPAPPAKRCDDELRNLREWVAAVLNEISGPDFQPTESTVDTLTQVVECRAREIAEEWRTPNPRGAAHRVLNPYDLNDVAKLRYGRARL